VPDYVIRTDPNDPDGLKINSIGKLPTNPAEDHTCALTDLTVTEQNFQEEVFSLLPNGIASPRGVVDADAGTVTYPALSIKYVWNDVKIVSTGEVPGSLFTATLDYTEDGCTAQYDVLGVWPITLCHTDLDCHPFPLPDATDTEIGIPGRRFQGSGLNPAFEDETHPFKCNNSAAVHAFTANYGIGGVYGVADWGVCEMTKPVSDFTAGK
jgi:hypothetical protein